jgi:uncharacterized delta-60 repeat protein
MVRSCLLESLESRCVLSTFTVSSLADSGAGSLRQAIKDANNHAGLDTIAFSATGTIKPTTQLDAVTDATIFDGTTVANYAGKPKVLIDGSLTSGSSGLVITADGCTVKGLAIGNFSGYAGLLIESSNNTVVANFFGTDLGGTVAKPNARGILLTPSSYYDVQDNVIGGTTVGDRNVVSGNTGDGIAILGAHDNTVLGNFVGVDYTGTAALGNGGAGVEIDTFSPLAFSYVPAAAGNSNKIGGIAHGEGNRIRYNGKGVLVYDGIENPIRGNSITANTALGIDLSGDGVTPNDKLDPDGGPNEMQNFPIVGGVGTTANTTSAAGVIMSMPNTTYSIDVYSSSSADATGYGEGSVYLGSTTTTTDGFGIGYWGMTSNTPTAAGWVISATATDPLNNTSEFSRAAAAAAAGAPATVQFYDAAPRYRENSGLAEIYVTRTGDLSVNTSVNYATSNDTATGGSDYSARGAKITFAPGQAFKIIQIPLINDSISEGVERFNVTLSNPVNGQIGTNNPAEVVITDDDFLDTHFSGDGKDMRGTTGDAGDTAVDVVTQSDGKYIVLGQSDDRIVLSRFNAGGTLDTTYGTQGKAVAPLTAISKAYALALQSDGKVVVVGNTYHTGAGYGTDTLLMRYTTAGALDTTFGTGGIVRTNLDSNFTIDEGRSVAIQSDGKIVVLATTQNEFVTLRYLTNGTLDTSFSGDGRVDVDITGPNTYDEPRSLTLQSDGKIVETGDVEGKVAVIRLNTDGSADTTFNSTGQFVANSFGSYGSVSGVQMDGTKILVTGGSTNGIGILRLNSNGTLDTSYSSDGIVDFTHSGGVKTAARQSDGMLIVGCSGNYQSSGFELLRFKADGSQDTSFNGSGSLVFGFDQYSTGDLAKIRFDANAKLMTVGGANNDEAVARVNTTTAALDTTFNSTGKTTLNFIGPYNDMGTDVITQPDGKVIVLSSTTPDSSSYGYYQPTVLYRYNADGTLDNTFGTGGVVSFTFQGTVGHSLGLQSTGKILINVDENNGPGVMRLNSNGSIDTAFGTSGVASSGGSGDLGDMVVQTNDKIILVGGGYFYDYINNVNVYEMDVVRMNADGTLDTAFSSDGLAQFQGMDGSGARAALDSSNRILMTSILDDANGQPEQLFVSRINTNGTLDTTFNGTGTRQIDPGVAGQPEANGIDVLSNGKIVVGAKYLTSGQFKFVLGQVQSNGTLDTTFGGTGVILSDFSVTNSQSTSMIADSNNRIIVVGEGVSYTNNGFNSGLAVARYLPSGARDADFGDGGILSFDYGANTNPFPSEVTEDKDHNLVVTGWADNGVTTDVATARIRTTADPGPFSVVSLSANNYTVSEGAGTLTVTAKRTGVTTGTATANWSISGGLTATVGKDLPFQSGTVNFAAGQTSKTFTINITNDALDEYDEQFRVSLVSATGTTQIGNPQNALVTITDDDNAPTISVNDVSITEGDSGYKDLTFTISISAASEKWITVVYHTAGSTATAPGDFAAIANTKIAFPQGTTSKQVTVKIKGDTVHEAQEKFFLDLTSPNANATILKSRGVATINDNDPAAGAAWDAVFAAWGSDDAKPKAPKAPNS